MYICLNRGTAGGSLPFEQFVQLAADAGFPGCDVDMGYVVQHGTSALRDLFAARKLRFGGWGPPVDWRAEASKQADGLAQLKTCAAAARELGIDSCCTWIMPSSQPPFIENWNFHVERLRPVARARSPSRVSASAGIRRALSPAAALYARVPFHARADARTCRRGRPQRRAARGLFHCHCSGTTWDTSRKSPANVSCSRT
jgi:hypothetical protein